MRKAEVYYNGELAGVLTEETRNNFTFRYTDSWFIDFTKPPVSLTLPKNRQEYSSEYLFPFFYNMLSEGFNKELQNKLLRIDENDSFGLLLATAQNDTIGAITIKAVELHESE